MASGLLALLDDVATLLDDVAILTKVAAKKTAGVLGDDLALNAQQVAGVAADRELPVVWAVAKGSTVNKLILVPAALGLSVAAPWAVTPLLMVGGAYLCFEGFEKVAHKLLHRGHGGDRAAEAEARLEAAGSVADLERTKIRGAIRTDFVLSAEIVAIALGTVAAEPLATRAAVLCGIAALMTVGVYGFVAAVVKLDDLGAHLVQRGEGAAGVGRAILTTAPWLMKGLGIAGTLAMFLVGGGIVAHGIPPLGHGIEHAVEGLGALAGTAGTLAEGLVGVLVGAAALGIVRAIGKLRGAKGAG